MFRCESCGERYDLRAAVKRCCSEQRDGREFIPMHWSYGRELAREDVQAKRLEIVESD